MKKKYICTDCGSVHSKWAGQCYNCNAWATVQEEITNITSYSSTAKLMGKVQEIAVLDDNVADNVRTPTTIEELNRVLGGGLVSGSAILIGGDPGIGKSTLLLQLSATLANQGLQCLYVTGEESLGQIKLRAVRLGLTNHATNILAATNLEDIIATIDLHHNQNYVVIIDSIQTMNSGELGSASGTVSQIRACTQILIDYTKRHNITLLLSCHVTKEGQLAGPKALEHMVDTVLYFEGDHNNHFRILRSIKNRFGGVNEVGVFEMTRQGLKEVSNPSALFLLDRDTLVSGSAIYAGAEGSRALLIEIQALIAPSYMATPRRSVVGWDSNRLSMMIAVLNVRFGLNLSAHEVYLSIVGGLKIAEPAADLAVAAALISAATNTPLSPSLVFFGEVGLAGEVRKVSKTDMRIKEAVKMGFTKMICATEASENLPLIHQIVHLKQLKTIIS